MADDIAVKLENVSKMYRLFPSKGHRLREALHPFRRTYHREFWALKDVTLAIPKGHTVGILGMNGSGKSTLLQIISSVLRPTSGTVQVSGKVAALLELGAGFNPELTGRENVILNGTIMGLSREQILARMAEIEAFADIGEFFDQPMKTHSSGMFMRVAFSTALYVDPDVLIIDEALSVGDAKFQEKCFRRFKRFQEAGKTILFVTHDRSAIPRYCDMGILLHQGQLLEVGEPGDIADLYGEILTFGQLRRQEHMPSPRQDEAVRHMAEPHEEPIDLAIGQVGSQATAQENPAGRAFIEGSSTEDRCRENPTYNRYEYRFGNGHARIIDYMIVHQDAVNIASLHAGAPIDIYFKVLFQEDVEAPILGVTFKNKEGVLVYGVNTEWMMEQPQRAKAGEVRSYRFSAKLNLCAGDWFMELAVAEGKAEICDDRSALAHLYLFEQRRYVGLARLETQFSEMAVILKKNKAPAPDPA